MKEIILSNGLKTLVDDEDYESLKSMKWYAIRGGSNPKIYPATFVFNNGKMKWLKLHRLLFGENPPALVDHKDGDTLNNCRNNLRPCTRQQNQFNRDPNKNKASRFKGVSCIKKDKSWKACIRIFGKMTHLGCFNNESEAAMTYDAAALRVHGEFARTNKMLGLL